jgi:hypothetical protein
MVCRFELPKSMFNDCHDGICYIANIKNGRKFGDFIEKTLLCNESAHNVINNICDEYNYTSSSEEYKNNEEFENNKDKLLIFTKLPVIILIRLMISLDKEDVVSQLTGAYPIAMTPNKCTCMNIIVGRRKNEDNSYNIDKFSLYYPNNHLCYKLYGKNWPILNGYAFRTAVLNGILNRSDLNKLRFNEIIQNKDINFIKESYGLKIDDLSEYEYCAYIEGVSSETSQEHLSRIENMVKHMVKAYHGEQGVLALSYDKKEKEENITALEGEFKLFKKYAMVNSGITEITPTNI